MRVHTNYSDGVYWLVKGDGYAGVGVDISWWRWVLYLIFCKVGSCIQRWLCGLDNKMLGD